MDPPVFLPPTAGVSCHTRPEQSCVHADPSAVTFQQGAHFPKGQGNEAEG